MLCDCRIASSAAAFGHPEIKFGAAPLFTPLQWIVGLGVARELCLTGRRMDAAEALRIGLVTRVTEPDDLLEGALAMARSIIEAPQVALETAKRYLISSASATFEEAFAVEHDQVFDEFLIGRAGPSSVWSWSTCWPRLRDSGFRTSTGGRTTGSCPAARSRWPGHATTAA